jgi:hypothetical protein
MRTRSLTHFRRDAMNRAMIGTLAAILGVASAALWVKLAVDAQRPRGSDVQQLRQMLTDGEKYAEQRNAPALGRFISDNYRDNLGMSDSALRYEMNNWFRQHRAVEVTIPSEAVQITLSPDGKTGAVTFPVSLGLQGQGQASTPSRHDLTLTLSVAKEPVHYFWIFPGEEWKVTSADGYAEAEGM